MRLTKEKPLVFISHITAERDIATALKDVIDTHLLGLFDVFVSSDGEMIELGEEWLDKITSALKRCAVEIVLCGPISVKRPWINFEAGAGWIRDVPVIPICHSGMTPADLPTPLNALQAARATDEAELCLIFPVLAKAIGGNPPQVVLTKFIEKVKDFESRYTFWTKVNEAFRLLNETDVRILDVVRSKQCEQFFLKESQIAALDPHMKFLESNSILQFNRLGDTTFGPAGSLFGCRFFALGDFERIVGHPSFHP